MTLVPSEIKRNMYSHNPSQFYYNHEVPPPQIPQHNWQWIQILQEKDKRILDMTKTIEEYKRSVKEQDDILDKYEEKHEVLEGKVKNKEEEIEHLNFNWRN